MSMKVILLTERLNQKTHTGALMTEFREDAAMTGGRQ